MVARYLADHAASLARQVAAPTSKVHAASDWPRPCQSEIVRASMPGIKRVKGAAQDQAKPPLREEMRRFYSHIGQALTCVSVVFCPR